VRASDGAVFEGAAVVRLSVIDPTDPSALATMPGAFRGVPLAVATAAADGAPSDVQLATLGAARAPWRRDTTRRLRVVPWKGRVGPAHASRPECVALFPSASHGSTLSHSARRRVKRGGALKRRTCLTRHIGTTSTQDPLTPYDTL